MHTSGGSNYLQRVTSPLLISYLHLQTLHLDESDAHRCSLPDRPAYSQVYSDDSGGWSRSTSGPHYRTAEQKVDSSV
jgi:hypothetical protein